MSSFYGAGFYGPGGGGGGIPSRQGITPELPVNLDKLDSGTYLISLYVELNKDGEPFYLPSNTLVSVTEDSTSGNKVITYELVQDGDIFLYTHTYQDDGQVITEKTPVPKAGHYDPTWHVI